MGEAFKKRSLQNKVGDPFESDTFQGPQVSQLQYDRIMGYIETGKKEGATVETGGECHGDKGYFIKPTIFSNVTPDMKIMQEEIFGPACAIAKFKDLNTSIRVANGLKAGTVWVNSYNLLTPQASFGGYKSSGIGRELGEAALANYTELKTVHMRLGGHMF